MPVTIAQQTMRLGTKPGWTKPALIWENPEGETKIFTISQRLFEALKLDGLAVEG